MAKFINGRWVSDAELYPEQYEELPEDALPKTRKHSVKLSDIGAEGEEPRGKSPQKADATVKNKASELSSLLGGTVPSWKQAEKAKDAVNPQKNTEEEDTVEYIYSKKRQDTAKAYAMKVVAAGSVTERKLIEKLKSRDYSETDIEEAIAYVKSFGYINDARLAQDMLDKLAARQWGRFKICYYLKGKGISEDVIEELDFSEIDFPYHCARLMKKYPAERRDAMLRAVKNAGYTADDVRKARLLMEDEE